MYEIVGMRLTEKVPAVMSAACSAMSPVRPATLFTGANCVTDAVS